MRSRICLQCNIFIKSSKGWRYKTHRRLGGIIHDECLEIYNKHRHALSQLRYKRRIKANTIRRRKTRVKYDREYYKNNSTRMRNNMKAWYYNNREYALEYARTHVNRKHPTDETDDVYRVKVL
jgi:hypothetical protein